MNGTPPHQSRTVVAAYGRLLRPLGGLLTSLVGIWGVATILGWVRAESYYRSFGAPWLFSSTPLGELVSFTVGPLVALGFGILLTFSDYGDNFSETTLRRISTFLISVAVLSLLVGIGLRHFWNDLAFAAFWSSAALYLVALVIGGRLAEVALAIYRNNYNSIIISQLALLTTWYIFNVSVTGTAEGLRDAHPSYTNLNTMVTLKNGKTRRLLVLRDDKMYLAELVENGSPTLTVIGPTDVVSITEASKIASPQNP